jgi:Ala-tRNA(Pro) deacylase
MIGLREEAEMAGKSLMEVLDEAGVDYVLLPHAHTETAAAEAEALGIDSADVGKTLVVAAPGGHVRVVLSASDRLDFHKLRGLLEGGKRVRLASEEELARDYPEFELGAVPPLGGTRSDEVFVDQRLAERASIVVEAGTHEQSLRIATADLVRVTAAEVADLAKTEEGA